jgi:hypothetical protein
MASKCPWSRWSDLTPHPTWPWAFFIAADRSIDRASARFARWGRAQVGARSLTCKLPGSALMPARVTCRLLTATSSHFVAASQNKIQAAQADGLWRIPWPGKWQVWQPAANSGRKLEVPGNITELKVGQAPIQLAAKRGRTLSTRCRPTTGTEHCPT